MKRNSGKISRLFALLLAICLLLGAAPAVLATEESVQPADTTELPGSTADEETSASPGSMPDVMLSEETDADEEEIQPVDESSMVPEAEVQERPSDEMHEEMASDEITSTSTDNTDETLTRTVGMGSEYEIVLGSQGVASGYDALDESTHAVGEFAVNRTYVLSFREESFSMLNGSGTLLRGSKGHIVRIDGTAPGSGMFAVNAEKTAAELNTAFGVRFTDPAALTEAGYADLDEDATAYYYLYLTPLQYAVLIQITPNGPASPETLAREALGEQISRVTGEHANDWVQTDDRYNGRTYSASGFWADLQPVLTSAQTTYESNAASLEELNAAEADLQTAIDALIPITCVNPTELYEAYQAELSVTRTLENYTEQTRAAYESAMSQTEAVLDGVLTEGRLLPVEQQPVLDAAVQGLADSIEDLFYCFEEGCAESARALLPALIREAEKAREGDYTPESWAVFAAALSAARQAAANTEELTGVSADSIYYTVFDELYDAYYWGLVPVGEITVHVTVLDSYRGCMRNVIQELRYGVDEDVKLSGSYMLADVVARYGMTVSDMNWTNFRQRIYINGIYVTNGNRYNPYYFYSCGLISGLMEKELITNVGALTMHPGDTVMITTNSRPQTNMGANITQDGASFYQYVDSLYSSRFRAEEGILTVHAGEAFIVGLEKTTGALGRSRVTVPADGMTLFSSTVYDEPGGNTRPRPMMNNGEMIITDDRGEAEITLYEEGWILLSAYDRREDVRGDYDSVGGSYVLPGDYHSMNTGAAVWVHVLPSENAEAVKAALQAELDEVYSGCDQTIFPNEEREQLHSLYQTAVEGIASAATTGEARSAQQTGILAIQDLYKAVITGNASKLSTFRRCLEQLPEDLNLVTAAQQGLVDTLISTYDSMSDYLQSQLTAGEMERYELIAALGDLPEAVNYRVNVMVVADSPEASATLQNMTGWLAENSLKEDEQIDWVLNGGADLELYASPFVTVNSERQYSSTFSPNDAVKLSLNLEYSAYYHIRNNEAPEIIGNGWRIVDDPDSGISFLPRFYMNYNVDGRFTVFIGEEEYEVKKIKIDGVEAPTESGYPSILDRSTYKGKDYEWVNLWFPDGLYAFTMPYNDVTVKIIWGPVHDSESDRTEALEALTDYFNGFVRGNYSDGNWEDLRSIYLAGVTALKTASEPSAVLVEYKARMDAVKTEGNVPLLGSVTVSFRNSTYESLWYDESGPFLSGTVDLYDNDSVMSVALRLLEEYGYTYEGTGGTGYGITYLAAVTLGLETLAEKMPGYGGSGWMVMLNNWFIHESASSFTVEDGRLKNGDTIEWVFTCDKGLDVRSGVEGIADTDMLDISADKGTLTPAFNGAVSEYVLSLEDDGPVKLTFEPQWRCFQSRAYKNSYTPSASSWYDSGETMYLKNGDVVYVGAGDPAWPSMSGNDGIALTASVYRIKIITPEATADVEEMIGDLRTVKYTNYTEVRPAVENARTAYEALSEEAKTQVNANLYEKLTTAERLIAEYAAFDVFHQELAAVDAKTADEETARAMVNAWNALTETQRKELTGAEESKLRALRQIVEPTTVNYGDANGDGKISVKDVVLLRRYIAKYDVGDIDLAAADANGDGKISVKDVVLLRRYIAKYDDAILGPG